MNLYDSKTEGKAMRTRLAVGIVLGVALLTGTVFTAVATPAPPPNERTDDRVAAFALKWFADMQAGRIDRAQLTADYNAQLTDDAVREMSRYLEEHKYGASPKRAQVVRARTIGKQTFYVVKLVFPRGDAASLMFGFNADGKISGISLLSMAGD
jgi:hypothetical protein